MNFVKINLYARNGWCKFDWNFLLPISDHWNLAYWWYLPTWSIVQDSSKETYLSWSENMKTLVKPKSCWWCTLLKIFFTLYCSTGIIIREYSKKYCSFYSAGVVVFASVRRTFLDGKPSCVYKRDYCSFQSLDILPCGILLFQFCWRQLAKHCVCRGSIYLK